MTFDEWFAKEYGDKCDQLGLVVPELMRQAYEAASGKQEAFVPCKCESDEGRICGRCHAWDDVVNPSGRPLTDEQIERIGRMWSTKRFDCDDIRAYLAATLDKSKTIDKEPK
jgi:hypothetical protein